MVNPALEQIRPATQPTTVGNYFVANYPPFSAWTPEHIPEALAMLERPPRPDANLGLYIHIPFCRKRCHFCYFRVYTDKSAQDVQNYLNALTSEMEFYHKKPFLEGRKPSFVYFGGGTPSFLPPKRLHELAENLQRYMPWDEVKEITFECEPGTLSESKLRAIRDIGVTRLSMGVENFSDEILEINNRSHRTAEIMRAYENARDVGFPIINIDLIAGMIGETEENWAKCIERTIDMAPDSVTLYLMEIPYNTTIYREMMLKQGKEAAPVADWDLKRRWMREAYDAFEKAGYSIDSAYTAVREPSKHRFLYCDHLCSGSDMLSLGVASFGYLNGVHYQNEHDFEPYLSQVERGGHAMHRALALSDEEQLIREIVLQQKLGPVDLNYFRKKFNLDPAQLFDQTLRRVEQEGWLMRDNDCITWTREGWLRIDDCLWDFFLPQHQGIRYT